eukprot:s3521_g1.t1
MSGHPNPKRLRRSNASTDLLCEDEPEFSTAEFTQGRRLPKRKQKEQVELPDGPISFEDLFHWARDVVQRVVQHWRLKNVSTSEKKVKLHLTTAYSGVGFGEAAAAMVADAFSKMTLFKVEIALHSQTEIDPACQEVLSAPHVFVDLCHRCDAHVVSMLKKMQQAKLKRLQQDRNLSKETLGREFLKDAMRYLNSLDSSVFCTCAWCCKCNAFCQWAPQVGPPQDGLVELWLELAGNTCTPWSACGKGLGYLDEASIPSFIWAFSLKKISRPPDALVNECTPRWPAQEFFGEVFDECVVETAVGSRQCGPCFVDSLGVPVNRPRAYSIVTLNELIQKKPYSFGVQLLQRVAFCNLMLKGSVFLTASEEEVSQYMSDLAERRSLPARVDGKPYRCLALMDFGDRNRLQQYVELLQSKHPFSFDWDVNVDLAQAPPFGSAHTVLPTIIRNSKLYNIREKRFFLPEELLSAHGVHPMVAGLIPDPLLRLCETHPSKAQKMIGNSMCIPQVGAVLASSSSGWPKSWGHRLTRCCKNAAFCRNGRNSAEERCKKRSRMKKDEGGDRGANIGNAAMLLIRHQ